MIQTKAMLANLTIQQWSARKQDKAVAAEVDKTHGASEAGRYNKLLIDKAALDPISKLAGELRATHYRFTMPWGDNGDRLLPGSLYMKYTDEIRQLRQSFEAVVNTFVTGYPTQVQAARARLGTLYDAEDYPDQHELYAKFGVNVTYSPVPDANDFRVDMSNEEMATVKANITADVQARQNEAVKDCYARAAEVIVRIRDRLGKKDSVFRDSLIENARLLADMLPGLNITGDPRLTELCDDIREQLLIDPKSLRANPYTRQKAADAASAILAKLPAGYA